uniref:Centrosomin N-terminal motif 1 domain-containing protein n=1 Tax=Globisporangium ultimum (strain ATCC 200006 / CBS 805.95 / DAOM BR144) TaxID=431595 RepID=K3W552_GLOUD
MRPSESASPDNGGGLSSPQAPPLMNTMLLREDQAERERLKMDNFNQALRINFLEERLLPTAKEYQTRYLHCEQELQQRAAQLEDAEQRLADVTVATSSSETAIMKQQTECANQFAAEKRELLQALHEEQQHADALERTMTELETTNANLMQLLDGIEREFSGVTGQQSRSTNPDRFHSLLPQVQGAIKSIQREFNTEAAKLQSQWQQQAETMTSQLDELSKQLHTSQGKLEVLQRTTVHVKDDKQATERTWMMKYEQLRVEKESERRTLERELRDTQSKVASAEAAAAQVKTELGVLTRRRDGTRAELERDYHDLKESNRLLYEEVQERRRAAEHARKQYLAAVKENKDLLAAVDVYKSAISEREKDIEYYKATLMKNTQQLQRRVSMGEVKQTLLEQLEQTQYMINETYKRWSDSDIGHGAIFTSNNNGMEQDSAVVVHLDEYIGRMEIVTERWNEFINQSRDLQRRYSSAWRSAVADFNARGDERQERPEWTDDVERRSTRLLTESVRVSEALRDVVENILSVIQRERNERKAFDKTRALESHDLKKMRANSLKEWQSSLSPKKSYADQRYDDKSRRESQSSPSNQLSHNETKKRNGSASRRSSSARGSERLGTNTIYHNSLSSLGRIGSELQEIEKKIQSYQE